MTYSVKFCNLILSVFWRVSPLGESSLAWGLVLGEIEFFLNLALATGHRLITVFALELRTDFSSSSFTCLLASVMSSSDFSARSSNRWIVASSERMVPSAVSVTRAA